MPMEYTIRGSCGNGQLRYKAAAYPPLLDIWQVAVRFYNSVGMAIRPFTIAPS
jgi:hypothetical protein